jgi:hypothetical protein
MKQRGGDSSLLVHAHQKNRVSERKWYRELYLILREESSYLSPPYFFRKPISLL